MDDVIPNSAPLPCGCANIDCPHTVIMDIDEMAALGTMFVIVDACTTGPQPDDILVKKRDGYGIYMSPHWTRTA